MIVGDNDAARATTYSAEQDPPLVEIHGIRPTYSDNLVIDQPSSSI
jgi:hypothetical protein